MRRFGGFTLTEVLVALAAGLIVAGSVIVFAVTAVRSNAQIVTGARVMQQMRTVLGLVTADVRRAGYYDDASRFAPQSHPIGASDVPVVRSPSCIVLRYDRDGAVYRGYRHAEHNGKGVIQSVKSRNIEPDCMSSTATGPGHWADITDPTIVDVKEFSFTSAAGGCTSLHGFAVITQDVNVRVKAVAAGSPTIARDLATTVRVRNDIMTAGSCT